jgi:hypothetical protein
MTYDAATVELFHTQPGGSLTGLPLHAMSGQFPFPDLVVGGACMCLQPRSAMSMVLDGCGALTAAHRGQGRCGQRLTCSCLSGPCWEYIWAATKSLRSSLAVANPAKSRQYTPPSTLPQWYSHSAASMATWVLPSPGGPTTCRQAGKAVQSEHGARPASTLPTPGPPPAGRQATLSSCIFPARSALAICKQAGQPGTQAGRRAGSLPLLPFPQDATDCDVQR